MPLLARLVPTSSRPGRVRRGAGRAALVVAAVVLLVESHVGRPAAAEGERRFLPGVVPDGLVLRSVHEPGALDIAVVHHLYLGEPGVADPFARRRAVVFTSPAPAEVDAAATVPVQVAGRRASFLDRATPDDLAAVRVVVGGSLVTVSSPHLGRDELVALAEAVEVRDGRAHLDGVVAGLVAVPDAGTATPFLAGDVGVRSLGYADDEGRVLVVAAVPDDGSRLRALEWWGGTPTTIAGRRAVVVRAGSAATPQRVALWVDRGSVIGVSGALSDAALAAVVAGVREVDAATWAAATTPVARPR